MGAWRIGQCLVDPWDVDFPGEETALSGAGIALQWGIAQVQELLTTLASAPGLRAAQGGQPMSPCHVPVPRPPAASLCPPAALPCPHIMSPCPPAASLRCDPQCSPTGGAPSWRGAEDRVRVQLPPGCVRAILLPAARGSPACGEVFCNHLLQRAAINGTGFEELTVRAACWRAGSAQKAIGRRRAAPGAGSDSVGYRRCGAGVGMGHGVHLVCIWLCCP